ncbi:hypothetical protein GE09DRAFT_1161878 [Coniochaeta sp. 2T2.1]|nr:hypothetical protein GE09DRAFT_1161878 [Coniochaeta sp. 2T2.1]
MPLYLVCLVRGSLADVFLFVNRLPSVVLPSPRLFITSHASSPRVTHDTFIRIPIHHQPIYPGAKTPSDHLLSEFSMGDVRRRRKAKTCSYTLTPPHAHTTSRIRGPRMGQHPVPATELLPLLFQCQLVRSK